MLVTAYCLSHGHWTVIPHHLEENFKDMADCGFHAVALSFSESEMAYSRRAFEIQVALARKCGLRVFVIPSRLGGRFAGSPLAPGLWISAHPEAQVPGHVGFAGPLACVENGGFRAWIREFMGTLLRDYPLDGIIWDEPKYENLVSTHPDTVAKYGPHPTPEQMEDGFVDFLSDLTAHCLSIRPGLTITLFNQKTSSPRFTRASAAVPGIRYAGYDGNLCRQSFFHEEPRWAKYRLESVWERTVEECADAKRGTFALVENMLMPRVAIPEYRANLEAYLKEYHPDHLALYYYAHNNEDPEAVHQVTRDLMKKYLP
ncbi:MAG: hypothetical protein J0L75_06945 [Spirochaetes bacterium]|nr:hypothetical protein [Spirochaetota bacterium]